MKEHILKYWVAISYAQIAIPTAFVVHAISISVFSSVPFPQDLFNQLLASLLFLVPAFLASLLFGFVVVLPITILLGFFNLLNTSVIASVILASCIACIYWDILPPTLSVTTLVVAGYTYWERLKRFDALTGRESIFLISPCLHDIKVYKFIKQYWYSILVTSLVLIFPLSLIIYYVWPPERTKTLDPFYLEISIPDIISEFDAKSSKVLFHYLAGNPAWEVFEKEGRLYAEKRKLLSGEIERHNLDEKYELVRPQYLGDGFIEDTTFHYRSSVKITLGKSSDYGAHFGPAVSRTEVNATKADLEVIHLQGKRVLPEFMSILVAQGNSINIEIWEETPDIKRSFTRITLKKLESELRAVLEHSKTIEQTGLMPVGNYYPYTPEPAPSLSVGGPGARSGIYELKANLKLDSEGIVETRVFHSETNKQLSKDRLGPKSRRYVGWSKTGSTFFEYNTDFTVYEGGWDTQYLARFEIWHVTQGGEYKLAEKSQLINGWQR